MSNDWLFPQQLQVTEATLRGQPPVVPAAESISRYQDENHPLLKFPKVLIGQIATAHCKRSFLHSDLPARTVSAS
jgi:hypothetical protein